MVIILIINIIITFLLILLFVNIHKFFKLNVDLAGVSKFRYAPITIVDV